MRRFLMLITAGLMLMTAQSSALDLRPTAPAPDRPAAATAAPFTPWAAGLAQLRQQNPVGRGQECPGGSGSFCTDRFPVCCAVGGSYSCQASRADCR